MKNVAVLIVNYNQKKYLPTCFASLHKQTVRANKVYYVDNASTDGSLDFVKKNYKAVISLANTSNEGFAKAVNRGMRKVFYDGFKFCILLNPDITLDKKAVMSLLETYEKNKKKNVGLIQPVLLLLKNTSKINSIGNAIHYLGFGYCRDYLKKYRVTKEDKEIIFASGAVMLISRNFYRRVGELDESFFLYCDDQDYSWRGRIAGYAHFLSSSAIAYHDYAFSRYASKMFHFEKNRWTMLLKNYSIKTLVFLSPMLIAIEVAMLAYALTHGFFIGKCKAYWYTLTHLYEIREKRKKIQATRVETDREVITTFDSDIHFFLIKKMKGIRIFNYILKTYYRVILFLL